MCPTSNLWDSIKAPANNISFKVTGLIQQKKSAHLLLWEMAFIIFVSCTGPSGGVKMANLSVGLA